MSESEEKALNGLSKMCSTLLEDIAQFQQGNQKDHYKQIINRDLGMLRNHEIMLTKKERFDERLVKQFYESFQKFIVESQKATKEQKNIDLAIEAIEASRHQFVNFKPYEFEVLRNHIKTVQKFSTMELKEDKDVVATAKLVRKELKRIVKDKD